MKYRNTVSIVLSAVVLSSAGPALAGCADEDAVQIRIPGYRQAPGTPEPKYVKTLERCMAREPVCLLLQDGKVIPGAKQSQVRVDRQAVVFAFVQEAHIGREAGSEPYCAVAALDSHIEDDDPQWLVQTFSPERGWGATVSREPVTRPMTSSEVFGRMNRKIALAKRQRRDEDVPVCGWLSEPDPGMQTGNRHPGV